MLPETENAYSFLYGNWDVMCNLLPIAMFTAITWIFIFIYVLLETWKNMKNS